MDFDWKRYKLWDFVVTGLFILMIIGLSLAWWTVSVPDELGGLLGGLGGDLGSVSGWDSGLLVFGFILTLAAWIFVVIKAFLPKNGEYPKWYMEGAVVTVLSILPLPFAIIRLADNPGGGGFGSELISRGAGGFITLIAALLILGAGIMMFLDKSGNYGVSKMPKINVNTGSTKPPADAPPAGPSGTPPTA